jgi:hypothetical protein
VQPTALQPLHVLTVKQWRGNQALQAELRQIIDNPVFLMAHQTLTSIAFPGVEPASKAEPNVSAAASDQALARRYVHRAGFSMFPRMLRALTSTASTQMPQTPYDQLLPEDE